MERMQGRYALVQFCPMPERFEFLNIGVLLIVPEVRFAAMRFAKGQARLDRAFGAQPKSYLSALKDGVEQRILAEIEKAPDGRSMEAFASKRANEVRVSGLLPIMVADAGASLNALFNELVGEESAIVREPRVRQKLRRALEMANVEGLLDRPDEIALPEFGVKLNAPYGYQNGLYNLVDAMRLSPVPGDALREAGKRAFEGGLLWKQFAKGPEPKRLVVVGDFASQSNEFYHAVSEQFLESNVKLHRLDNIRPLINDIQSNALQHRSFTA